MPALDYQTAFHLAPIGLVLSRARMIEDCNDELASIFGCRREALIGESFQVLYPSADEFERIGERIPPIMTAQGSYADDRIMKRANGELFWCHVTGRSLRRAIPKRSSAPCATSRSCALGRLNKFPCAVRPISTTVSTV